MRQPTSGLLSRYLNIFMGLAYMGGGIFLIASSQSFGMLPSGALRYIFAAILLIYGAFRMLRGFQRFRDL
ncbi:hypothetical protein LX87_02628 [Larkinella arboricola]|uniref:Uncharacterized protein n=1 Tax=Larkinella arboricola TaxID=643671 RepID=A0A327WZ89_LARAB|nr:hypothetical protein LX87_02628 [Larkinella arboricola]